MKFKFGDKVKVVKGRFHKGAVGMVVGFFFEESKPKVRRYRVVLYGGAGNTGDNQIHASHSWLEKATLKDGI